MFYLRGGRENIIEKKPLHAHTNQKKKKPNVYAAK